MGQRETSTPGRGQAPTRTDLSAAGRLLLARVESRVFDRNTEPARVGRFVLLEVLGRGGTGVVYKAYDPKLDRSVAVKVLSSLHAMADQRMLREAKALARLSHPNVVTIHEVDEDDREVFVAMEYVDGGTLDSWCAEHPPGSAARTRAVLGYAYQAIEGLAAAHDLGVVHRDVKPANMLLGTDDRLRLADFGLARPLPAAQDVADAPQAPVDALNLTATGAAVGTPAYMSPEQFEGRADARSDQFGFCASFFEALFGVRPFAGGSAPELVEAIEHRRFVTTAADHVPDYVTRVLQRGLSPRPEARFPDMRALGRALRAGGARRRTVVVGTTLGIAAVGVGAAIFAAQPAACRDEREVIEASLSGDRRAALEQALHASGVPFADETWTRAAPRLDEIVEAWATQRLEACRLSRDDDTERAATGRHQSECLDRAASTLYEALADIGELTTEQAGGFVDYVGVLADVADCGEARGKAYESELGLELLAELHRGRLATRAFEPDAAVAAFGEVLARTEPGQLPRLRAEAHGQLIPIAHAADDEEAQREHAIAALDEAEAAGDPNLIADGWLQLARLMSPPARWESVELVLGRVRRLDDLGVLARSTQAELARVEAVLRLDHNQPAEAARLIRRATELAEEAGGLELSRFYSELGYMLTMEGKLEQALDAAQRAVSEAQKRYGPNHPFTAISAMRIAEVQSFLGRESEEQRTLDEIIGVLARNPSYRGDVLAMAYARRGMSRRILGRNEEALEDMGRALEIHRSRNSPGVKIGRIHEGVARIYYNLERHDAALREVDAALQLLDGTLMHELGLRASTLVLRGRLLGELGRRIEAVEQLEAARAPIDEAFPWSSVGHAMEIEEIAAGYAIVERWDRAQQTLGLYLDTDRELGAVSRGRLELARARIYLGAGDLASASLWARRGQATLREAGAGETDLGEAADVLERTGG